MKYGKITFKEIFEELKINIDSFENGHLYLPQNFEGDIKIDTELFFGESIEIDEETYKEIIPKEITEKGFGQGYLTEYLKDVFSVLSEEKPNFSNTEFLKAFNYYIDKDTFIPIKML